MADLPQSTKDRLEKDHRTANDVYSTFSNVLNIVTSFFGLNLNTLNPALKKAIMNSKEAINLANRFLDEYANKMATTTPSTAPSFDTFLQSYKEKNASRIRELRDKLQLQTERLEDTRNSSYINFNHNEDLINQANSTTKETEDEIKRINDETGRAANHYKQAMDTRFSSAFQNLTTQKGQNEKPKMKN